MNHRNRVFALTLTGAMLAGVLATGASAVTFTDAASITQTEAVNAMAELGVLKGKDDGSFDPQGTVTRAEMAKIITAMLNKGGEPDQEILEFLEAPAFTDTEGHWAQNYVVYCASLEIIDGREEGVFDPEGAVTGSECAKMLLVALGYAPEVFALTGEDWEINTNNFANQAELYKGLDEIDVSQPVSREAAARMARNALDTRYMVRERAGVTSQGEVSYSFELSEKTFWEAYFSAED